MPTFPVGIALVLVRLARFLPGEDFSTGERQPGLCKEGLRSATLRDWLQGVLVAGGVGVSMVFTRLLHDSLPSGVRAGALT